MEGWKLWVFWSSQKVCCIEWVVMENQMALRQNRLRWYSPVLRKYDDMAYEVEGVEPRGRALKGVVYSYLEHLNLIASDALDQIRSGGVKGIKAKVAVAVSEVFLFDVVPSPGCHGKGLLKSVLLLTKPLVVVRESDGNRVVWFVTLLLYVCSCPVLENQVDSQVSMIQR